MVSETNTLPPSIEQEDTSWLDGATQAPALPPVPDVTDDDMSWLQLPGDIANITSGKKLAREKRTTEMDKKNTSDKERAWHSNGQYLFYRPKLVEKMRRGDERHATQTRLLDQITKGEIVFSHNEDDVQVFKIQPSSPFYRPEFDYASADMPTLIRKAITTAVTRDWGGHLEVLEILAEHFKAQVPGDFEKKGPMPESFWRENFSNTVQHIHNMIAQWGGPSKQEMSNEIFALRARRKGGTANRIALPPGFKR
jgi:hypothetical protein